MVCTNSSLVVYTKLSPNCTKPRNHDIDTISIHTMAGNLSVETCGLLFADPKRQASSNYGIGSDGRIAMYVEEHNRSWCTSNRANDMRAITIEVASINTTDFMPSDAAFDALISLVADICKRNNIKALIWDTDKSARINHKNGCNMTVHRDFKNKACPGDWLYLHMDDISKKVNTRLSSPALIPSGPVISPGANEELEMYRFLKSKKENNIVIFSLMGNIWAESGIRANNLQNSFEKRLGTDEEYTKKVDNGSYTNFVRDGAGYGYAQWTFWSRKQKLLEYAKKKGVSIANPQMQREFFYEELTTTYKGMMAELRKAKTIREGSDIVLTKYERPKDQSEAVKIRRASYGQMLYDKYAGVEDPTPSNEPTKVQLPFRVRVIDSCLNIRKEPNAKSAKVGSITDHGVYTIVEIEYVGTTMWGKLKSGVGWICLTKYTEKL